MKIIILKAIHFSRLGTGYGIHEIYYEYINTYDLNYYFTKVDMQFNSYHFCEIYYSQ